MDDLTAKTLLAVADAPLRARIGAKARQRVRAHSLDRVAAAYAAVIEDVLRGRMRLGMVGTRRPAYASLIDDVIRRHRGPA